jgi:precorrin-2 dehydrogenase/sirohydrochlorin ferrochelatase
LIVDLNLKGGLIIVVGGGTEALKKVDSLLTQDCKILVISDKINTQLSNYKKQKKINFKKIKLNDVNILSKYKPVLIMASTDNRELNKRIVMKAKKMRCYAYATDDPKISDFSHPSVINIGDTIQVAISTGGRSPLMAKKIKLEAEKIFKKVIKIEDIYQIQLQQIAREAAKGAIFSQKERKKFLYSIVNDKEIKQLIKDRKLKKAQQRALLMLRKRK